jgi:hypothetical protein
VSTVVRVAKVSSSGLFARNCSMPVEMKRIVLLINDSVIAVSIAGIRNV